MKVAFVFFVKFTDKDKCLLLDMAMLCKKIGIEIVTIFFDIDNEYIDENWNKLINDIKKGDFDIVFNECFKGAYFFSEKLIGRFNNVITLLNDLYEIPKEKYCFLYNNCNDISSYERILRGGKFILTNFTKEQHLFWAKKYGVFDDQFIFFPKWCNKNKFLKRDVCINNYKRILYWGDLKSTNEPEIVDAKAFYDKVIIMLEQGFEILILVSESNFDQIISDLAFLDYAYLIKFNANFQIIKQTEFDSDLLDKIGFAFFSDTFFDYEIGLYHEVYKYCIPDIFSNYLEMGVPMFVNSNMTALSNIIEENKIGLVFEENTLNNIFEILNVDESYYFELVNNVYNFREDFKITSSKVFFLFEILEGYYIQK